MQAIRACVAATVRRDLKEPVAPVERSHEERVTFRWRRFLLLTNLVVTVSTAQLCLMTQDEIRERKLREAQETRNRLRSANQEQQVADGRLGDADLGLPASYRTESVSRECIPGMDDVSVMWSTLESKDGPGRHSGEDGADNRPTSSDLPIQDVHQRRDYNRWQTKRRHSSDAVGFLFVKEWCTHLILWNHVFRRPRTHQVECSSRLICDTTGATIPTGTASASFVFWHHGSGSTTGDRSNVSRQTAESQGEQSSSDLARHDAEDLNNTGVLQSVRVWTDKTDGNADTWEAAIQHFNKVGTSSGFLMEIDKGCLQPSIFDDSIFGEYIGSLVKNAVGNWNLL